MSYVAPAIIASGAVFSQLRAGGISNQIDRIIATQVATGTPVTAPTVSATGVSTAGGSLAAGGYRVKFTETNGVGETPAAPVSAAMTVAAGNIPLVTFPALQSGNVARNVYLTPANAVTGTEVLYATGVTAITTGLSSVASTGPSAVAPPTVTSTGLVGGQNAGAVENRTMAIVRSIKLGQFDQQYKAFAGQLDSFLRGDPVPYASFLARFRQFHTAVAILNTSLSELGTLIDANQGTLGRTTNGVGASIGRRTWS